MLRVGRGRYLLILNDDMIVLPGAFEKMVRFMDLHSEVGAVGCKLLNPDGTLQHSCWRGYPTITTVMVNDFYLWKLFPHWNLVKRYWIPFETLDGPLEVDHLLGACIMVRRKTLDQVGLLDERFYMTREDTDWCYRIKQAGWKICWIPDGEIIHYGEQTTFRSPGEYLPELYRSYCNYQRKHHGGSDSVITLKMVLSLGVLLRIGLWAGRGLIGRRGDQAKAMMRGYWQVLRQLPGF